MKKIIIIASIVGFAIVCVILAMGKDNQEVNIAYFDNITHGQALVMQNQNSLEKAMEGKKVNWIAFNSGPAEVEALFAGDIDIGYIGPVPAITANIRAQGDFVIISAATNQGAVLIAKSDASITSVDDLEGKNVAIPQLGNTQHLLLLDLLKKSNLKTTADGGNVNVIECSNSDVANLMNSGDVDAALVPEPWGTLILNQTESSVVLDYNEMNNGEPYSTAVVIVNRDFMKKHEDDVKAFLQAHLDATNYIIENPEGACEAMDEQLQRDTGKKLGTDAIHEAIKKIEYTWKIPVDSIMKYANLSAEIGFITEKPKKDIFDTNILEELKQK